MNEDLEKLKEDIQSCNKCDLRKNVIYPCWDSLGNVDSKIMIVGEAPGKDEAREGIPFIGKCGQYLLRCLLSIGLSRNKVFITNTCMCRPIIEGRDKDRVPTSEEITSCIPYLFKQIELIKPSILIPLGRVSTCAFLNRNVSLSEVRAKLHDYCYDSNIKIFPMYHPSFIQTYADNDTIKQNWKDFLELKRIIKELGI